MRLKMNGSTAVVVRKSWANLQAIKLFLRDRSPHEIEPPENDSSEIGRPDESHTIFVHVLDDTDERGLWIELNTKEHQEDPAVELQALMIPWHEVLAIAVGNDFTSALEEGQKLAASLTRIGSRNLERTNPGRTNLGRTNGNSKPR
jgi:hypothetical protein